MRRSKLVVEEPEIALEEQSIIPEKDNAQAINFKENEKKTTDDQIQICSEAITSLESITEIMRSSLKSGGLNKAGSDIMYITLEEIYTKVGLSTSNIIPALEAFHAPAVRIGSTTEAMESIAVKVKEIQEKVIKLTEYKKELEAQ